MKKISLTATLLLIFMTIFLPALAEEITPEKAREIGQENIQKLVTQSYHYRVEYDTVIVLPVHSKTVWKNDFYLLYFLKDDYFQVEMEVDGKTGTPTILAMGKMSPPYQEHHSGTFNHRYFCLDSVMHYASIRRRLQQDSAQLVYFGVIPRLGKRGVAWEMFSSEGSVYISPGGPSLTFDQLVRDMNLGQMRHGNYTDDSLHIDEIMNEMARLNNLTEAEKRELQLFPQVLDSLIDSLKQERQEIIMRFPNLGRYYPIDQ